MFVVKCYFRKFLRKKKFLRDDITLPLFEIIFFLLGFIAALEIKSNKRDYYDGVVILEFLESSNIF
jgi:hypothetical protein